MQISLIVLLVLGAGAIVFAVQNATPVTVVFFLWRFDASLAIVIVACVGLGALLSALATLPGIVRTRLQARRQQRHIQELEQALAGPRGPGAIRPAPAPAQANSPGAFPGVD